MRFFYRDFKYERALPNNSLTIFTILALIILIGLVANNAIILVEFPNRSTVARETIYKALVHSNYTRSRPFLMTKIARVK